MPTEPTPKELERRFVEEAFNKGHLAIVDEIFAENYRGHTSTRAEPMEGPEAMKGYIEWARSAFPDLEIQLQHLIVEENLVASHWLASGTHQGELMGIEATGETYEAPGMEITRVEKNKIVEQWHVGDQLGMLQQLGIVEVPG